MGGGKRGDKHVYVTIDIADGQGQPVSGVDVSIDVFLAGAFYDDYSGTTGADGSVTFQVRNAPSGNYNTDVTSVSGTGYVWDSSADAPDPGYTKP